MYQGISVEWIHGTVPTAHFYDQEGYEIESATMSDLNQAQITEFFQTHNFPLSRKIIQYEEDGKGEWSWGGHHYELFSQRNPLAFAKQFASSRSHNDLPGYLTTISSLEEQNVLLDMMNKFGVEHIWIDGSDEETEGAWKWLSGEHANRQFSEEREEEIFIGWNHGEPNNAGEEDCLVLSRGTTRNNELRNGWNDVSCSDETSSIVIEYGADPHDSSPFSEISSSHEEEVEEKKEEL